MGDTVIIAPHCDDEIIGCYEVLEKEKAIVVFTEEMNKERVEETKRLKEFFDIKLFYFNKSVPPMLLNKDNTLYFPHPTYEIHPAHRQQGIIGEQLARQGLNVIFYTTNMNAPFMREVKDPEGKKKALNEIYPSQSDLWKYDHKYFLFEGSSQWLF